MIMIFMRKDWSFCYIYFPYFRSPKVVYNKAPVDSLPAEHINMSLYELPPHIDAKYDHLLQQYLDG